MKHQENMTSSQELRSAWNDLDVVIIRQAAAIMNMLRDVPNNKNMLIIKKNIGNLSILGCRETRDAFLQRKPYKNYVMTFPTTQQKLKIFKNRNFRSEMYLIEKNSQGWLTCIMKSTMEGSMILKLNQYKLSTLKNNGKNKVEKKISRGCRACRQY